MDKEIIERQIDSDGTLEDSFRLDSKQGLLLKNKLLQCDMKFETLLHDVELISYHPKDLLSFDDETICIIYNTLPPPELLKELQCENSDYRDYYGVKVNLKTKELKYKLYLDLDEEESLRPNIESIIAKYPCNCRLAEEFGVGFYPTSKKDMYIDFYFYTDNIKDIYEYCGIKEPDESSKYPEYKLALVGQTYKNGKLVKIKRYMYPNDIGIENPDFIYGER